MNKWFKSSVSNLSLIGLGTSFGCCQQNTSGASAKQEIYWYQKLIPYLILAWFGIKCAKQVECENDIEELSELIKKKPLETSVDYKNYNEVVEKIESLNETIEAIGRSVKNNSWILDKSKEKLVSIQNDISGKEAYLNNLHKEAEFPIKKSIYKCPKAEVRRNN